MHSMVRYCPRHCPRPPPCAPEVHWCPGDVGFSYPCLFCRMSSSDFIGSDTDGSVKAEPQSAQENEEGARAPQKEAKPGKKRVPPRGKHSTPMKRARQFPEVMDVRGEAMWCLACECPVSHHDKSAALSHIKSKKHATNVEKNFIL